MILKMAKIFVFGSNLAGRHGKGAALFAKQNRGAVYGVGIGRTGNSYAIPTKDAALRFLPLPTIQLFVNDFMDYAVKAIDLEFEVTRIGCGLAGYQDHEIAPMFENAPKNCHLPNGWDRRQYSSSVDSYPLEAKDPGQIHPFGWAE